ncbi:MAG TPA: abscisic acid-deficient protein Aba4 family protein [Sphingomicrobium sp.]|nr:abscisic acid-deficient protein Aba4 family protein [Sphingomicrobium sp.]
MAFDLFVGLWVARDADAKGFSRLAQLPVLFLVLMAGPIGLFVWLIVRDARARA